MTRLARPNDWIERLGEEVEKRAKHLSTMNERAPKTFEHLMATVRADVNRLNAELYERKTLEIDSVDTESFRFGVDHLRADYRVDIDLDVESDKLTYYFSPGRSGEFQCHIDGLGGLSFSEGGRAIQLDEISRRILEPIVRAEFKLDLNRDSR